MYLVVVKYAIINSLGQLPNLRCLNLTSNKIRLLPSSISKVLFAFYHLHSLSRKLSRLHSLNLSLNREPEIPPEISALTNLEELKINSSVLGEIPLHLLSALSIRYLFLSDNQIPS